MGKQGLWASPDRKEIKMSAYWQRVFAIISVFLVFTACPPMSSGEENTDVIEKLPGGQVNWTKGIVQAVGVRGPTGKSFGKAADRVDAQTEARDLARKNLLKTLLDLRLNSGTTVGDIAANAPVIDSEIRDMVKEAQVAKQAYLSDGTINVTMQLNISGGLSQLLLPEEIKQIDPIKTVSDGPKDSDSAKDLNNEPEIRKEIYSGLIVDAAGIDVLPAMVVKIFNENDQEVYGTAFVSREFAVQNGMIRYIRDRTSARCMPQMKGNPLVVKGLRTRGPGRSDIVISNADAEKLRGTSEHISFLRQCRVLIVTDPPDGD